METASTTAAPVNITVKLLGADAEKFREYMAREFIGINSVAATKLMLERLAQLEESNGKKNKGRRTA